jgi:HEAT repeat protein
MAIPVPVKLRCPLCTHTFQARAMGSSYFISGVDTDLRETGSIEDVRRFSVATCPSCRYSDYSWDFEPEDLTEEAKKRLAVALERPEAPRPSGKRGVVSDLDRIVLADRCFEARQLDASSRAELALLAYYVTRDLGRRDLEAVERDRAVDLFEEALAAEDLPPPLALRYHYITGELQRRGGLSDDALAHFDRAIKASMESSRDDEFADSAAASFDLGGLARRQRAAIRHENDPVATLLKLTKSQEPEEASEARRLLARRRGKQAAQAVKKAWKDAPSRDRVHMLRELIQDPPEALSDLFTKSLKSESSEEVRLAARALGLLGDPKALEPLIEALDRGVLATEVAIADALRRIEAPKKYDAIKRVLERWENKGVQGEGGFNDKDEAWRFGSDPAPLKTLLYTSGESYGLELLVRDMRAIEDNDLWDKPPSGSPVQAAIALERRAVPLLRRLLKDKNPGARRWAAFCLAELESPGAPSGESEIVKDLKPLLKDKDRAVRLEVARAIGRFESKKEGGPDPEAEAIVLKELSKLDESDLPFALHFLVPFRSERVKSFVLDLLERGVALPGEVYPLLGRQEEDSRVRKLLETGLEDISDDARAGAVTGLSFLATQPGAVRTGSSRARRGSKGTAVADREGTSLAASIPGRLRILFDEDDSDDVRRRIVFALARLALEGIDRDETVGFLKARLQGGERRLRFPLALALLQLGDDSGIEDVRERAALFDESADHYDLVAPALKALAQFVPAGR